MKKWYYYLHTNGDLINKNPVVVDSDPQYFDSSFVEKVWMIDLEERGDAWKLVLESLALGARIERVKELVEKWNLTKEDSFELLARTNADGSGVSQQMQDGLTMFVEKILGMDIETYWNEVKGFFAKNLDKAGVK